MGIALIAASVLETMTGSNIADKVNAPDIIDPPLDPAVEFTIGIKIIAPASPKMIEGIPEVATIRFLIARDILFSLAYSCKYIAQPMPRGSANSKVRPII